MRRGQSRWPELRLFRTGGGEAHSARLPWTLLVVKWTARGNREDRYYFKTALSALQYANNICNQVTADLAVIYGRGARTRTSTPDLDE